MCEFGPHPVCFFREKTRPETYRKWGSASGRRVPNNAPGLCAPCCLRGFLCPHQEVRRRYFWGQALLPACLRPGSPATVRGKQGPAPRPPPLLPFVSHNEHNPPGPPVLVKQKDMTPISLQKIETARNRHGAAPSAPLSPMLGSPGVAPGVVDVNWRPRRSLCLARTGAATNGERRGGKRRAQRRPPLNPL